jgi:hypothetical protein
LEATTEPLTFHSASLLLQDRATQLSFDQQKQNWLDAFVSKMDQRSRNSPMAKDESSGLPILWSWRKELNPAADLYPYVAARLGIAPSFDLQDPVPQGILIYPTVLDDSVFYVLVSDTAEGTRIDLRDKLRAAARIRSRVYSGMHRAESALFNTADTVPGASPTRAATAFSVTAPGWLSLDFLFFPIRAARL